MTIVLRSREGADEIHSERGENLLYAGLRAGLPLAYECATGTCGTCRARLKQGRVSDAWPQAPGRSHLQPELGDILLCQAHADGDCEILLPGKQAKRPQHRIVPMHGNGRIERVRSLTQDVLAFDLLLEHPTSFLAGQFLCLELPGVPGYRAYSMTNFAEACERVSFVVKRMPGGGVSSLMFSGAIEGTRARYFGPLGGAVFLPEDDCDILCIAGGSGVAGMLSLLEQAVSTGYLRTHRGALFFGVRSHADAFFLDEIASLVTRASNLQVVVALSHESVPSTNRHGMLHFDTGFVHEVAAKHMQGRYENTIAYVAGPPPMVDESLRVLLTQGLLGTDAIRYDKFA